MLTLALYVNFAPPRYGPENGDLWRLTVRGNGLFISFGLVIERVLSFIFDETRGAAAWNKIQVIKSQHFSIVRKEQCLKVRRTSQSKYLDGISNFLSLIQSVVHTLRNQLAFGPPLPKHSEYESQ